MTALSWPRTGVDRGSARFLTYATGGIALASSLAMLTTMQKTALVNELAVLRSAIATHQARISDAVDVCDAAEIAFVDGFGFLPWEAPEYAVGWSAARAVVDSLRDERGYFWADSRVRDLEMILESGRLVSDPTADWSTAYVWGIGNMPKAHAVVGPWVLGLFGLSAAA